MNRGWPHLLPLALAALAGCATPAGDDGARSDAPVRPGSTLVLERALTLPPGDARVYFQHGSVTRFHDRDRFRPWCSLGARRDDGGALPPVIEPGRFAITAVRSGARAGAAAFAPTRVAVRSFRRAGIDRGGSLGHLTWTLEMRLDSVAQPAVHDLRCAVDRPADWRGRLGLASVRDALGDLGRLVPPGDADPARQSHRP